MSKKLIQAAAGNAGEESVYVEDVFSTYLYEGTGAAQSITNGIDFAGEGGMLWIKDRDATSNNYITDTERSLAYLRTNSTSAEVAHTATYDVTALNSDGFSVGLTNEGVNTNGNSNVSWSFRKQEGFFDVVTYTGNGTAGRTVSHNLGSVPGCIIVKSTSTTGNWMVYHRGTASDAETDVIRLNLTNAAVDTALTWNDTAPTSTEFTLGTSSDTNNSGTTYVAYLFAHDDQSFGDDSDESIIKCGSYTGNGSNDGPSITLGWEPQWILVKRAVGGTGNWVLLDVWRGLIVGDGDRWLQANKTDQEFGANIIAPTATGFELDIDTNDFNASGSTYIYIAIRRPMKTPESGTEVFKANDVDNGASKPDSLSDFPVDMYFRRYVNTTNDTYLLTRLTSPNALKTNATDAEAAFSTDSAGFDYNDGVMNIFSSDNSDFHTWMFKRATGFFDVVAYTGTGASTKTLNHNLGVIPELIIFKRRTNNTNTDAEWKVWSGNNTTDSTYFLVLDKDQAEEQQNSGLDIVSSLSSTEFTVKNAIDGTAKGQLNRSTEDYISYLFATLAGVSKVGSYTGTAANLDVDCGFSAGARFILIKRTDSTGDWYVYDSERGIVAGNDPYLLLNSTAAEVTSTDYIDPLSSGFTVTSSAPAGLNASGGTYIFLAIA